jgi:hypothetical protein
MRALADACMVLGDLEKAFDVSATTLNMQPDNENLRAQLAAIYRMLKLPDAAAKLTAGLEPKKPH